MPGDGLEDVWLSGAGGWPEGFVAVGAWPLAGVLDCPLGFGKSARARGLLELKNWSHGGRNSIFTPAYIAIPNAQTKPKRPAITTPIIRTIGFASRLRFFFLGKFDRHGGIGETCGRRRTRRCLAGNIGEIDVFKTFVLVCLGQTSGVILLVRTFVLDFTPGATPGRIAVGRLGRQFVNFLGQRHGGWLAGSPKGSASTSMG